MGSSQLMLLGSLTVPPVYATWNPSDKAASVTLSNGNKTASTNVLQTGAGVRATIGKASGKHYFEVLLSACDGINQFIGVGVVNSSASLSQYPGQNSNGWGYGTALTSEASLFPIFAYNNSSSGSAGTPTACVTGNYLNVAFDADAGKLWFGKDGTWMDGDPSAGTGANWTSLTGTLFPMIRFYTHNTSVDTGIANFGASAFNNTVPTGFNPGWYS